MLTKVKLSFTEMDWHYEPTICQRFSSNCTNSHTNKGTRKLLKIPGTKCNQINMKFKRENISHADGYTSKPNAKNQKVWVQKRMLQSIRMQNLSCTCWHVGKKGYCLGTWIEGNIYLRIWGSICLQCLNEKCQIDQLEGRVVHSSKLLDIFQSHSFCISPTV